MADLAFEKKNLASSKIFNKHRKIYLRASPETK